MKYFLSIFISLITLNLQAQTFEEFIKSGNDFYKQEAYLKSAEAYSAAFQLKEGSGFQYYNAACSWALAGDTVQALNYLNLSADKGWRSLAQTKRDKDLQSLYSNSGWKQVLAKIKANLDEFEKDYDQPLKAQLDQIYLQDQTLRQIYREAEQKFGKDSEEMKYFWALMAEEDKKNEAQLAEIIEERGWPGQSLVGGKANMTVWLVVQHMGLDMQIKYLPLMQESVAKGESSGRHLSTLEDRILVRTNKPQVYGTQFSFDKEKQQNVFDEIKDPEYVNQRRKAIGLGPIEAYAKKYGMEWDVEQKEKE